MRSIANLVHLSFRAVERTAHWLTGSAGPLFVAICIVLVAAGIWTFFTSMFAQLAQPPPELRDLFRTHSPAHIALGLVPTIYDSFTQTPSQAARFLATLAICLFIILNIVWHYYMACTQPPGSVLEGLGDSVRQRRSGPGSSIWWARYRTRASNASGPPVHRLASTTTITSTLPQTSAVHMPPLFPSSRSSSSSSSSSHCSSSSQSSLSFGSPRPARSPLPVSMQEAELHHPPRRTLPHHQDAAADADADDDIFPLARMCHKCPKVPLWKALSVLPPELRKVEKQLRTHNNKPAPTTETVAAATTSKAAQAHGQAYYVADNEDDEGEAEIRAWLGDDDAVKLVSPPKPERAHHCRVCKTCTLKYDHHCPWINGCVGLGNERYFVLFMTWLSIGCAVIAASGWRVVRQTFEFQKDWPYPYTPRVSVLLLYVLAVVMGLALAVMAAWQFVVVARGETSVESSDNAYYREKASKRDQPFDNVYDVGRLKNLQLFFNVGSGSPHGYHTLVLPTRVPPYSDGWHWAKKRGLGGRHAGVTAGEELTDEEVE